MDHPYHAFHVTWSGNLDSIAKEGLQPGSGRGIGSGGGYSAYSRGKLFFCGPDDVGYWFGKSEDWAEHLCDGTFTEDGYVPVVLVFAWPKKYMQDEMAVRDGRSDSYYTEKTIPAKKILAWDGEAWGPLDDVNPELAVEVVEPDPDDYEDEEEWSMASSHEVLIYPRPLEPSDEDLAALEEDED
jgi:hypothetical protein